MKKKSLKLTTVLLVSTSLLAPVTQVFAESTNNEIVTEQPQSISQSEVGVQQEKTSDEFLQRNENDLNKSLTEDELNRLQQEFSKQPNAKTADEESSTRAVDKSITSLTVKVSSNKTARFDTTFTQDPNSNDPYVGDAIGDATVPIEGIIEGAFLNPGKAINDYRRGNYGARVLIQFPEGVDAKSFFKIADWEKSRLMSNLFIKILGIPTPVEMKFPLLWDKESVRYSNSNPNELSMVIRGMDKEHVSEAEWESYPQAINELAITASATTNIGSLKGSATGNIYTNLKNYTGNVDDFSENKVLTAGKLPPSKNRKIEVKFYVQDRSVLVAGGQGKGNISKAETILGKEYSNPADNNKIDTWREYISPWDNEKVLNTQLSANPEIINENYTLPGATIFDRKLELITSQDGDFNKFAKNRFDRIVDYYDRANVIGGGVNNIDSVNLKHYPENIDYNKQTNITYNGHLTYLDGSNRQLSPANLTVDMKTQKPTINLNSDTPDTIISGDDLILKGTFKGNDAKEFVMHYKIDNGEWKIGKKFSNTPGVSMDWDSTLVGLNLGKHSVQVKALDSVGQESNILTHTVNVVEESISKGSIKANDFTIGDANITGTYTGDVKKLRLYINGVSVAWGGTVENGKFTFYAGNQIISATDIITLNAYDKDDNLLQENAPVKVNNATVAGSISPAEYSIGDTEITGSYTGDVAKARITINGKVQAWGGSFTNGHFSYYVGTGKIKAGDKVTITAYDKNDKVLDANKVVKIKAAATQGSISPSEYSVGDTEITGSYTGDVAKARVIINGKTQAWGGSFNSGRFTYYIGNGKIKGGDTVTITAYDKNDKVLDANKPVKINAFVQGTISPSVYNVGETTIKGSYTGDIVRARALINGEPQVWGGAFNNGKFSYYIGSGKIKAGDNVKIVGYGEDNSELDTKVVTIQK